MEQILRRVRIRLLARITLLDESPEMFWNDRMDQMRSSRLFDFPHFTNVSISALFRARLAAFEGNLVKLQIISMHFVWMGFSNSLPTSTRLNTTRSLEASVFCRYGDKILARTRNGVDKDLWTKTYRNRALFSKMDQSCARIYTRLFQKLVVQIVLLSSDRLLLVATRLRRRLDG